MAMTAALAQSAAIAVKVDFTYRGSFAGESVRVEDDCFVVPMLLQRWGWTITTHEEHVEVMIDGRMFRLPVRTIDDRVMVNLAEACGYAGANFRWNEAKDTFLIRGSIRNVELTSDGIRIDGTLPFQVKSFKVAKPDRLVIDLVGSELEARLMADLPEGWRVGQFNSNTVRVVIEHPTMVSQTVPKSVVARNFASPLRSVNPAAAALDQTPPLTQEPVAPVVKPALLAGPTFSAKSDRELVLTLPFTNGVPGAPSATYVSPTTVQVNFPNSTFASFGLHQIEDSVWLKSYTVTGENANASLILDLTAPMAFELGIRDGTVKIRLFRPMKADGNLTGKVIIIDAGHGGKDSGSRHGNIYEKNIVLPISQLTARLLTEEGAAVVLTRNEDAFITLGDRSKVANASQAALFVSIHVNSNTVANSRSGGMTFYHQQDPVGMLLAECIQTEIAKVSKIPTMGIWSDRRIYQSGFAVLRNSKMPSVLIELGFINHSHDRARMVQADFREQIAKAIVRGVKVFLGDETKD